MASDVQDGGRNPREYNFQIWQHFCIQSFAISLYVDPNSYLPKEPKMVVRSKMADQSQFLQHNSGNCQYFFNLFFALD
jgi:hypothetical protein